MTNVKTNTKKAQNAKAKNAKKKKPSEYKSQVLAVNSRLKTETKTVGGSIKMILLFAKETGIDARRTKLLRFLQKDDKAYKGFVGLVRKSKNGNYCPFYVLQALNKNIAQIEIDNKITK